MARLRRLGAEKEKKDRKGLISHSRKYIGNMKIVHRHCENLYDFHIAGDVEVAQIFSPALLSGSARLAVALIHRH